MSNTESTSVGCFKFIVRILYTGHDGESNIIRTSNISRLLKYIIAKLGKLLYFDTYFIFLLGKMTSFMNVFLFLPTSFTILKRTFYLLLIAICWQSRKGN